MPVKQQVGQLGRGAREDAGVAGVLGSGPFVEALPAGARGVGAVVQEHDDVAEQVHTLPPRPGLLSADLRHDLGGVRPVTRGDEANVH
jgi:hypothetical protein